MPPPSSPPPAHGAIVARRTLPAVSFTLVSAATGVQLLGSVYVIAPSMLLFLLSLYSYSAHARRPAPAIGLATGIGGAVVAVAGFALAGRPMDSDLLTHVFVRFLPCVVAAWSLGMFRRVRVDYVAALEERALRAEAEREERARRAVADERARIAREMHDIVAHTLSVVISQANGGRYAAQADPEQGVETLTTRTRNEFGYEVETYRGIPLINPREKDGSAEPIIATEATGWTSLYAVRFGLDGVHGFTTTGDELVRTWLPDFITAGAVKTGEVEMGPVAVVVKRTRSAGALRINVAPYGPNRCPQRVTIAGTEGSVPVEITDQPVEVVDHTPPTPKTTTRK